MLTELFQHYQQRSLVHQLDPRAKIAWVVAISLLAMSLGDARLLGLLSAIALAPWAAARPPLRRLKALLAILTAALVGTMLTQGVFYSWEPRTPLMTLLSPSVPVFGTITGGVHVYREGLIYGAVQSLRFLSAIAAGMLIVLTTHPGDLLLAATRLKLPARFAFMLTVALRFLPLMIEETQRTLVAQQVRGVRLRGVRNTTRGLLRALVPLVVGALRRARQLALAAEARAYTGERSSVKELRFRGRDWAVIALVGVLVVAGAAALYGGFGARPAGVY